MKYLILVLFIFIQCQNVSCRPNDITDFFSNTWHNFKKSVVSTYEAIKKNLSSAFNPKTPDYKKGSDQTKVKSKKGFNDFVEESAAERDNENYDILRSEPTALMSTPQLVTIHGKRVESHVVPTSDGYMLTLHRITVPKYLKVSNEIVLLHHGLLGSSADWIMLGPNDSLPYILSNAGYDIWLVNARGNYYSRGHINKRVDDEDFWKFSFQEMGTYDLPAITDYIRNTTHNESLINFIGHSIGTSAFLVMVSQMPKYNNYYRMGILLAPLAFMTNAQGPLKLLTSICLEPPKQLFRVIGKGEFVPSRRIPKWLVEKHCTGPSIFCTNPVFFMSGIPPERKWEVSFMARLHYHVPAGGSTQTIIHYAQLVKSGKFQSFGNGIEFSLNRATVPIALISSDDDWLSTVPDVLKLYFSLQSPIDHYVIKGKKLTHTDFVWGSDAKRLVFSRIIEFLDNGLSYPKKPNEIPQ